MSKTARATLESEIEHISDNNIEDTEEMFWLRQEDDYQSCVKLGNALSAQYRFNEAARIYLKAAEIKGDDPVIYVRAGGAFLSVLQFEKAKECYDKAAAKGMKQEALAYAMGVWNYLQGAYAAALELFEKCPRADGEMKIAVIYWHTLSALKADAEPTLLVEYSADMEVGHHTAYREAVAVMSREKSSEEAAMQNEAVNALDKAILFYALYVYESCGRFDTNNAHDMNKKSVGASSHAIEYLNKALEAASVWPCISYLAAYCEK